MGTTAIIAAYNEERTIAHVLDVLTRHPLIDEIIVVSDGSTDRTVEIARGYDVRIVALRENWGKGYAMRVGVEHASHDILFFVDGDMHVTDEHVAALMTPVLAGECEMNIGVRHRGRIINWFHLDMQCGPVLSGIRVMKRKVFEEVPLQYQERFKIEAALNCFCSRAGYRQRHTIIHNLGHLTKEAKLGLANGLRARYEMLREVFLMMFDLYVFETWRWTPPPSELPGADYDVIE